MASDSSLEQDFLSYFHTGRYFSLLNGHESQDRERTTSSLIQ
jgi:hypothetical protein